jgi:hypothetical protein
MNERIKQLAIEATEYVDVPMPNEIYNLGEGVFRRIPTFNQEKFAKLIIRKCAKVADLADENKCEWIGGNILNHFGVEE